ncbi:MAG: M48 family metallopeptidase [Pseudomonadota bacterium]
MTALAQYVRLEAPGIYFDGETARPREVVLKFGDASLIILAMDDMPIGHWSLSGLREIGEAAGAVTLSPGFDDDERLTIEDEDMIAAIREVCADLRQARPETSRRWRKTILWTGGAVASVYLILFHIIPALSDQLAHLLPPEAEVALGENMIEQVAPIFAKDGEPRFCSTPGGDKALAKMVERLIGGASLYVPLRVHVLDHNTENAFAFPGGQIVLFRGLLKKADGPEMVAGVLAHEIGHVAARDPTRLAIRAAGSAGLLGLILGDFTGATGAVALSEALIRSSYRRQAEAEADDFAAAILAERGLPTTPLADFFLKLRDRSGEPTGLLSHLSTHPDLGMRARAMVASDRIGEGAFDPVLSDQDWVALKGICDE